MTLQTLLISVTLSLFSATTFAKQPIFVTPEWAYKNQDKIKFIDLSSKDQYQKFHLPNATWINYGWLIKPQNGLQLSGGEDYMAKVFSQLGVKPDDYVVIYDNLGNLDSSRLFWEMASMQHKNVSIMDGGTVSWVLNGYPVTQDLPNIQRVNYPTPKVTDAARFTADKKDVLAAIKDPKVVLLDTRTEEEYVGNKKDKRSGHIPTAKFFPWEASVDGRNGYRQRDDKELTNFLNQVGIQDKNQEVILYCNTAHRAARLVPMFLSLGYNNVKLYDGSMQEWAIDKSLPVKTGAQP